MNMNALVMAVALVACAPTTPTPTPVEGEDTCGMAAQRNLIGVPADQIDRSRLPPRTRIITPDMMVTQDFVPERLNVIVGTHGRVSSLRCF